MYVLQLVLFYNVLWSLRVGVQCEHWHLLMWQMTHLNTLLFTHVMSVSQFPEHSVVNILPPHELKMPSRGCCNHLVCGQQNIRRG
jgi:hypothetical protein